MNVSGISTNSIVGRLLRLPLKAIPNRLQVRVLQGPLKGKRWLVGSGTHGCWLGSYEYAKQKCFAAALQRGDVVWDVGANVGFYSLLSSILVGPQGHVFSLEPVPRNITFLRKHLELNAISNCTVLDLAVGNSDALVTFNLGKTNFTGSVKSGQSGATENVITVEMARLDTLVASGILSPPRVIKCDIEGGEFDALNGAAQTLLACHPMIFLATHGAVVHAQCCRLLAELSYELLPLDGHSLESTDEIVAVWPRLKTGA